jgi:hypothetical protein
VKGSIAPLNTGTKTGIVLIVTQRLEAREWKKERVRIYVDIVGEIGLEK